MIAHSRVEFLGAGGGGGGFPYAAYGTAVAYWDASDSVVGGGVITSIPNRVNPAVGPLLATPGPATQPTLGATAWNGADPGAQFVAASRDVLLASSLGIGVNDFTIVVAASQNDYSIIQILHSWFANTGLDAHQFVAIYGAVLIMERYASGSAGGTAAPLGKSCWIVQLTGMTLKIYRNGVELFNSTSGIWSADFQSYAVGNQSTLNGSDRGFGGVWKASIIYSSLSQPIAVLDADFRAFYGV